MKVPVFLCNHYFDLENYEFYTVDGSFELQFDAVTEVHFDKYRMPLTIIEFENKITNTRIKGFRSENTRYKFL